MAIYGTIFIFLLISGLYGRALFGSGVVNPLFFFFAIWGGDFLLLSLNGFIGVFLVTVTSQAAILFLESFVAFGTGAIMVGFLLGPPVTSTKSTESLRADFVGLQICSRWIALVYIIGVIIKYILVVRAYGPTGFIAMARVGQSDGSFNYPLIVRIMTVPGYLLAMNMGVLAALKTSWRIWVAFAAFVIIAAANDALTGFRGQSMGFPLFFFASWSVARIAAGEHVRLKHLLTVAISAASLATILLGVQLATLLGNSSRIGENFALQSLAAPFLLNYVDIVGTIPAVSWYAENHYGPADAPFGRMTFQAFYQLKDIVTGPLGIPITPDLEMKSALTNTFSGNTFTAVSYLTMFQSDFGNIGAATLSFMLGALSTIFVLQAFRTGRVAAIEIAGMFLALLLFSWRGFYTADGLFWSTIIFAVLQGYYLNGLRSGQDLDVSADYNLSTSA